MDPRTWETSVKAQDRVLKCNKRFFCSGDLVADGLFPLHGPLQNPGRAREQYNRQGYLYIPNFLPSSSVWNLRRSYFSLWERSNGRNLDYGIYGHPAYEFVRTSMFQHFSEQPRLKCIADLLLSGESRLLKRRILRHFTKDTERSSRAHIDWAYLDQGSLDFLTIWIPIGHCSIDMGGLLYLRNSHLLDYAKIKRAFPDDGQSPWLSDNLNKISAITGSSWLGQSFSAGDIVVHHPKIIHAALNCRTDEHRLSIDLRFMKKGSPSDPRWSAFWRADDGY